MRGIRIGLYLLVLSLITVLPAAAAASTSKAAVYAVTLKSAELVENNHVGNEWDVSASAGGKPLAVGDTVHIAIKPGTSLKLGASATELDKYPDNGQSAVTLSAAKLGSQRSVRLSVIVVENRGRYSGNTATWYFTFSIVKK